MNIIVEKIKNNNKNDFILNNITNNQKMNNDPYFFENTSKYIEQYKP